MALFTSACQQERRKYRGRFRVYNIQKDPAFCHFLLVLLQLQSTNANINEMYTSNLLSLFTLFAITILVPYTSAGAFDGDAACNGHSLQFKESVLITTCGDAAVDVKLDLNKCYKLDKYGFPQPEPK